MRHRINRPERRQAPVIVRAESRGRFPGNHDWTRLKRAERNRDQLLEKGSLGSTGSLGSIRNNRLLRRHVRSINRHTVPRQPRMDAIETTLIARILRIWMFRRIRVICVNSVLQAGRAKTNCLKKDHWDLRDLWDQSERQILRHHPTIGRIASMGPTMTRARHRPGRMRFRCSTSGA